MRISTYFLFYWHIMLLQVLFLESAKLFTALRSHQQHTLLIFVLMNERRRENGTNINVLLASIPKQLSVHWPSNGRMFLVGALCIVVERSFQPHYGPGIDSASNRNDYQESSWEVKGGRRVKADSLTAICEPIF
jgi:hypothetical protein